nr:uncharacterized protein LOC127337155 isoform X2 [Lolium perenne]
MITTVSCVLVEIMMIVNICSLSVILAKEFRTTVRLSANQETIYYKWLQMLEEDSGTSKLSEPAIEEFSHEQPMDFDPFGTDVGLSSDEEMHSAPHVSEPAITSTSQTLVVSKNLELPLETTDLPASTRAITKKPRTGAASKGVIAAGNSLTPFLDDPITKEMIDMAARFIGFRDEADTLRRSLHIDQEHAKELEKKLKASEKARRDAEAKAASAELALSDKDEQISQREANIIARLNTQSTRFSKRIGEMYTKNQEQEEDDLLDSLSVLEMNCSLARDCLKESRVAFERFFPHFFPKVVMPDKFEPLAKSFIGKDDLVLAHRQASLKVGVESTIALAIANGEKVDWAKMASVRGLTKDKWTALLKSAKPFSKKLIAIIDPTSSSTSTAQTEVK